MSKFPENFLLVIAAVLLASCSTVGDLFSEDETPPLEGERISVLELQEALEPEDVVLKKQGLLAPAPWKNEFWPQRGGYPNHSMQNLALNEGELKKVWKADIGKGSTGELPLTAQPVLVDGRIYTLDTEHQLSAFDAKTGERLWRSDVSKPEEEDDPVIGGGIASSAGIIFVTNGFDEVLAVQPLNGSILWRARIPAPSRAAPTVMEGRLFVTTLDNRLVTMSARDGSVLWEYVGVGEMAGLVGAASPAANRDIVVPAFSSGEIVALRVENGSVAWSDNLSSLKRFGGLAGISDIKALPVLDKGMVIAMSFSGKIAAIDERTGVRIWQREIGGANTPWVAGNHIFVLSSENQLVALGRDSGTIRWVTRIKNDRGNPVFFTGPIMAGSRLYLAGTNGIILEANPDTGKILHKWDSGDTIAIPPIIAGETMYILSEDGTLSAWR